jgi:hypothetical protein
MQVSKNVKSPNNIGEWQMGFNSAFKGLMFNGVLYPGEQYVRIGDSIHYCAVLK